MSVRKSLAWSYGTHLFIFLATFGSTIISSRLLTPRELGIFGVGTAISGILSTISYFGVANYLIRERYLSAQIVATSFTVNAILSSFVGVVLWLLGTVGQSLFVDPAVPSILRWLSLIPALQIFEFLPATLLARDMQFRPISLLQLAKAVVNAAAVIGFALAGWGFLSPAIGAIMSAALGAFAYSIVGRRHVSIDLSLRGGSAVVRFAVQMISASGFSILAARIAELIIANAFGLSALGLYTRASGLAAMVWDGAYGLSTRVIYIQMSAELRRTGSLTSSFLTSTKLLTAVMWPIIGGIAVLSGPIIYWLYGPKWGGAALPLMIIMIGQFIAIGFAMNWELCVLVDRTAWQARVEAARAAIGLAAFAIGALFNMPIATAGRVVDALIGYAIYQPRMAEMAGTTMIEVRKAYHGNLLLALVANGPAVGILALLGWPRAMAIDWLAIAIGSGVALWVFTLSAIGHPLFDEMKELATHVKFRGALALSGHRGDN